MSSYGSYTSLSFRSTPGNGENTHRSNRHSPRQHSHNHYHRHNHNHHYHGNQNTARKHQVYYQTHHALCKRAFSGESHGKFTFPQTINSKCKSHKTNTIISGQFLQFHRKHRRIVSTRVARTVEKVRVHHLAAIHYVAVSALTLKVVVYMGLDYRFLNRFKLMSAPQAQIRLF